jgi:hypothetical protein
MIVKAENSDTEESRSGFPEVPDEAIVKPEDERPEEMIVLIWMETVVQTRVPSAGPASIS